MEQVIISTSVIISFLVGAGLSWSLFRMLHQQEIENIKQFETVQNEIITIKESLYKAEAEKSALKIEMKRLISEAVSHGYEDNAEKEVKIAELTKQLATQEADYIKQLQIEKKIAYERGSTEALKDYQIVCTPFLRYDDMFFKKKTIGGYSYQLFVKGMPVFQPAETVLQSVNKYDEEVKKTILHVVNTAVKLASGRIGGIALEAVSTKISKI